MSVDCFLAIKRGKIEIGGLTVKNSEKQKLIK